MIFLLCSADWFSQRALNVLLIPYCLTFNACSMERILVMFSLHSIKPEMIHHTDLLILSFFCEVAAQIDIEDISTQV